MACRSSIAGFRMRLWVVRLVLLLVGVLAVRAWYVEGLTVPCPVAGGSMAETLLGVHREVTCDDCGKAFVCDADFRPVGSRAVCPNCGYADNDLEALPDLAGDRVLIDKLIFQFRRPRRWEVVAFRQPGQESRTLVKRVVGLPGESIQIRHGDVYADGKIQRKTLAQQRALAILVHDADYEPRIDPAAGPRWQGGENSRWMAAEGRFACAEISEERPEDDWIEYRHLCPVPGRPGELREGPITDICGYNQSRPRREEEVQRVGDVLLSLRLVKTSGRGQLVIRASDGREEFRVCIDPKRGGYEVFRNDRAVQRATGKISSVADGLEIEVSLFDRQFLVAFDGRPVVSVPCETLGTRPRGSLRPLAIGSRGGLGVEVRDLWVYRDVYYTHPIGLQGRWGLEDAVGLGVEEYFVLGDNSPISEDSRTWPEGPALEAKLLLGKPLVVHFPARMVVVGGWRFQVPDPGRIRYIR